MNRFVAQKRGVDLTTARRPSQMGRLGRACLYASFAVAVSATGVMAASDAAVPGDVLYPLKRGIETMRLEVLPEQYRDELAAYALTERVGELGQLVEAGEVARASALAESIHDAYELAVAESDDPAQLARRIDRQVAWLEQVVSGLPERARAAIDHAMASAPGLMLDAWESSSSGAAAGPGSSAGQGPGSNQGNGRGGGSGAGAPDDGSSSDAAPTPEATPKPERTPKPDRTPKPEPTPSDDSSSTPAPSPKANGNPHSPAP